MGIGRYLEVFDCDQMGLESASAVGLLNCLQMASGLWRSSRSKDQVIVDRQFPFVTWLPGPLVHLELICSTNGSAGGGECFTATGTVITAAELTTAGYLPFSRPIRKIQCERERKKVQKLIAPDMDVRKKVEIWTH